MPHAPDRPLVGIPCCTRMLDPHPFHVVGDKFIRAVAEGADALPLLIPALGDWYDPATLVDHLDGLLVTGSPSNVEPHHYGGTASRPGTMHDPERDRTTLSLIRAALAAGLPLLAICRGIQEINVALGGTLHQEVHAVPGRIDHRADESKSLDRQYGPAHPVRLTEGGVLAGVFGTEQIVVNSIHGQGIDRLADGLAVEAIAEDGQIEAVRVVDAPQFAVAVQWHPEWQFWENPQSTALFAAFGATVRRRRDRRLARAAAE
ncbi:MAG: gamma-glutamyl-gamma-aminobutyrate hydrolase family protein [Inquilinus sp.]|nr:gamma-glutamyl-gamma-aminobutyrate hydrolase family protein [Inquilinus sp.]